MRVGVIGHGRMGRALATALHRHGHEVLIAARPDSPRPCPATGSPAGCVVNVAELVHRAQIVMLAVPFPAALELIRGELARAGGERPLVDVTNPAIDARYCGRPAPASSGTEELAAHAPGWQLVKAFNTVPAGLVGTPVLDRQPSTVPVASDCPQAKTQVLDLAASLGFDAADAGGIDASRQLESLAVLLMDLGANQGVGAEVGFRLERRVTLTGTERPRSREPHDAGRSLRRCQ